MGDGGVEATSSERGRGRDQGGFGSLDDDDDVADVEPGYGIRFDSGAAGAASEGSSAPVMKIQLSKTAELEDGETLWVAGNARGIGGEEEGGDGGAVQLTRFGQGSTYRMTALIEPPQNVGFPPRHGMRNRVSACMQPGNNAVDGDGRLPPHPSQCCALTFSFSRGQGVVSYRFLIRRGADVVWEAGPERRLSVSDGKPGKGLVGDGGVFERGGPSSATQQTLVVASAPVHPGAEKAPCVITLSVGCETKFGDQVMVIGSHPHLGAWDPTAALVMMTSLELYPKWVCQFAVAHDSGPVR